MKRFVLFVLVALVLISGIALAVNYSQTKEYVLSANYVSPIMKYVQHMLSVGFQIGKLVSVAYSNVLSIAFKLGGLRGFSFPFTLGVFIGPRPPQLESVLGIAVLCEGQCLPATAITSQTTTIGLGQPTYPVFSTQAINWFSIMGLMFLPCVLLGVYAGPMGCVAGLGMGFTAGVLTGLIPVWAVLVIVIIIVGLLFARRERG